MPAYVKLPDVKMREVGPLIRLFITIPRSKSEQLKAESLPAPKPITVTAVIDTGASRTAVAPSIIQQLDVEPIAKSQYLWQGSEETYESSIYPVCLFFADGPIWHELPVVEFKRMQVGAECLIGRDILRQAIFVYDGITDDFMLRFPAPNEIL